MARRFMLGDIVCVHGGNEATVTYVGTNFLKTNKGWLCIERTVLIRPGNGTYKNQFKPWTKKTIHSTHREVGPYGNKIKTSKVFFDTEVSSSVEARLAISEMMEK